MNDLTALTLLPQEQLTLASYHELAEMHRYRRTALCFLPTARHVSRLMATLGMECEQRLERLRSVAEQLELSACVAADRRLPPPSTSETAKHFFIVDDAMAALRLDQTLDAACHSRRFYDRLLETNATSELHRILQAFARQKQAECQVLAEFRAQWNEVVPENRTRR
ncbi:hypothetical protein HOP52_16215 [Halomonas campisalis]|uniref:Uncharacterized protein n=1 Tax=Billgrantia campisalis TaxID=74661 RepID=A0ABS9PC04_9GAMM|nr:hypothetical protein [Halomonas campisalis]MCG6659304.1 hypothetical protein [Halomonas campisalis]MDR5863905.1 hypothetical protein [Halomonas campisalis]